MCMLSDAAELCTLQEFWLQQSTIVFNDEILLIFNEFKFNEPTNIKEKHLDDHLREFNGNKRNLY